MLLSATAAVGQGPASGDLRWFDIGVVPLSRALVTVGLQGGVSVAGTDPILAQRHLRAAIRGRMTVEQALSRLLAGTGLVAVRSAPCVYRIERARRIADPAPPPPRRDPPPPSVVGAEVVVMASKRGVPIEDYPGSAHMLTADDLTIGRG
ncbi:MAG: STN domain-containing protein, partial [Sphingomonas parapaucimobilis]